MIVHLLLDVIADLRAAHQPRLLLLSMTQLRASTRLLTVHDAERAACVRIVRVTSCTSGSLLETSIPLAVTNDIVLFQRASVATHLTGFTLNYNRIVHLLLFCARCSTGNIETLPVKVCRAMR